ncbi:hypothetical protein, partial [Streptomyces sp. GC420]|uniref:hypothetical protein n=1 Tax=Streptomyces sp. GC420 TaxID=2697568 RepID=UPI001415297C
MNGPGQGAVKPPSNEGTVITLRVVLIILTLLSCGTLAFVPMVRVAILSRRPADWAVCCVVAAWSFGGFMVAGSTPTESWQSDAGVIALLLTIPVVSVYYIVRDMALHKRPAQAPYPVVPAAGAPPYGYPHRTEPQPPV